MLTPDLVAPDTRVKIYLCTGHTDMRKGVHSLSLLARVFDT